MVANSTNSKKDTNNNNQQIPQDPYIIQAASSKSTHQLSPGYSRANTRAKLLARARARKFGVCVFVVRRGLQLVSEPTSFVVNIIIIIWVCSRSAFGLDFAVRAWYNSNKKVWLINSARTRSEKTMATSWSVHDNRTIESSSATAKISSKKISPLKKVTHYFSL